jgi:hypothetical protein
MKLAYALLALLAGCVVTSGDPPRSPEDAAEAAEVRRVAAELKTNRAASLNNQRAAADADRAEWCRSHPCDALPGKPRDQGGSPKEYEKESAQSIAERNAAAASAAQVEQSATDDKVRGCLSAGESCFAKCGAIAKPKWGTASDNGLGEGGPRALRPAVR